MNIPPIMKFIRPIGTGVNPILTEAEELVQAYAGVDSEVIESGQIREMSRTKLVVLLERSYNKDES